MHYFLVGIQEVILDCLKYEKDSFEVLFFL